MIPYPRWAFTYTHTHKYRRSQGAAVGSLEKLEPNLRERAADDASPLRPAASARIYPLY